MRSTFIAMCTVLAASAMLCGASVWMHYSAVDEMDAMCKETVGYVRSEDAEGALESIERLEKRFDSWSAWLETVSSHDVLHEALACITDARVALECDDFDDAYQAMERLHGNFEHIREHEGMSLSNIY